MYFNWAAWLTWACDVDPSVCLIWYGHTEPKMDGELAVYRLGSELVGRHGL